jgi:biopolymer transport protein ExbD/biopolymer transport protein TolR
MQRRLEPIEVESMGIANEGETGRLVSEINVTPMVDVMVVLLIIFMVIAPMLQPRIRVAVRKAKNPDPDMRIDQETSLVLAAPEQGQFYLNRELVAPERIQDRISAFLKDTPPESRVVFVKSGITVRYGTVVSLISAIRSAGCDRIALVSEKQADRAQVRRE